MSGTIVAANNLSDGAIRAGMSVDDVRGKKWWSWHPPAQQRKIQKNLARCVQHDETVEFTLRSNTHGQIEHWLMRLTPAEVHGVTSVLCVAKPATSRGTQLRPVRLTKPQMAMLRLLAADVPLANLASRLRATPNAVGHRLERLREKFGVHSNYGLIAAAGRHGLLT